MAGYETEVLAVAFLLTLLAGLSTGIGAVMAFLLKKRSTVPLSVGLGFSAGVMIYISFEDILPLATEALAKHFPSGEAKLLALAAFLGGIILTALIDRLVPNDVNPHELPEMNEVDGLKTGGHTHAHLDLRRTGVFTAVAIAVHNFPEGFATFLAALDGQAVGVAIALAVAIHNIPEGIAVSLPIYHATGNKKQAFWYSLLSGLAEPLGAIIGFALLAPFLNDILMGVVFGLVAGIMIYISFDELLPASRVYGNSHSTIFGIVTGFMVMGVSLVLFELI